MRIDRPIFFFLEGFDFAFAFDNQAQRNRLHASRRKAASHFIPQQRRDLISHESVEHAASLLRVYQVLIDGTRMFKGSLHSPLGDFVEGDALNARRRFRLAFLYLGLLGFFPFTVAVEFESQMKGNCLSFAVRVRRQIDGIRRGRQLFQPGHHFSLPGMTT